MQFLKKLRSLYLFETTSATVLTILVYLAILIVGEWQDYPRLPPRRVSEVDLEQAYDDLKVVRQTQFLGITAAPHPYNSRRNDEVRAILLEKVQAIARDHALVEIALDDSNATWSTQSSALASYHESLNILVRVNGSESSLDGTLFSAHYDSVSTGLGATDDGMGVVTLLQLIQFFAKNQPRRTAVFNINNGEEDGLNGAYAFMNHPWSQNLATFLNLEGAGSGGRPMLFRSSNAQVTRLFKNAVHSHGNSISADAFARGLIRSGTDYSVYEANGMRGLDFAFYRHRSQYHTRYDSVQNLQGPKALWNMLENSLAVAKAMAAEGPRGEADDKVLYFDILGEALLVMTHKTAVVLNILLLVLGPLIILLLGIFAHGKNKIYWSWHGWIRFPVAIVAAAGLDSLLVFAYWKINPHITYSAEQSVLFSLASLAFITIWAVMHTSSRLFPIPCQRHITLIEYYVITWILLVVDTSLITRKGISSAYVVKFFNAAAFLGVTLSLVEVLFFKPRTPQSEISADVDDPDVETAIVVERAEESSASQGHATDANEETPLLVAHRKVIGLKSELYDEKQAAGMWLAEFIVLVPFPVILVFQIVLAILYGLDGTLSDGGDPVLLLTVAAVAGLLMALPLSPFVHKVHFGVALLLGVLFILTTLYNLFAFPFSPAAPLKVYFQQRINLDSGVHQVHVSAIDPYLKESILPEIPSAAKGSWCGTRGLRYPVPECRYIGPAPNVTSDDLSSWLTFSARRRNGTSQVRITLTGEDTRSCRIYLDEPSQVVKVQVNNQTQIASSSTGFGTIKLWGRKWSDTFTVDLELNGKEGKDGQSKGLRPAPLKGKVACEWSENIGQRIPALSELVTFMPIWATVTKADEGLVEAYRRFEI